MHPQNRPHRVDQTTGDFLFQIYTLLFEAKHLSLRTKQRTFETAADSNNTWRVVSISQDALDHINNEKTAKGLRRAHILSRSDRAKYLFGREEPLSKNKLLEYFFEHDTVALVTATENGKPGSGHWTRLYAVPEGILTTGSFSIYARKLDIKWVMGVLGGIGAKA